MELYTPDFIVRDWQGGGGAGLMLLQRESENLRVNGKGRGRNNMIYVNNDCYSFV